MPGRDGTGPVGMVAMAGRGLGPCAGAGVNRFGAGLGFGQRRRLAGRRGFGRGYALNYTADQVDTKTQKEILQEQKEILKNNLETIDKQLDNL